MRSPAEIDRSAAPQAGGASNDTFCPPAQRRFVLVAAILASALGFIDGSVVLDRHSRDTQRHRREFR
ncbi:MAG: hypothetical protein NVV72_11565 [Asticcacaulis sp.]|nr:hypothetical protein [Asticcacaulis sp.]